MAESFLGQKRIRKLRQTTEALEMPNLIEVQKSSYDLFLRSGDSDIPLDGEDHGCVPVGVPDQGFQRTSVLEFVKYEWKSRNMTLKNASSAT